MQPCLYALPFLCWNQTLNLTAEFAPFRMIAVLESIISTSDSVFQEFRRFTQYWLSSPYFLLDYISIYSYKCDYCPHGVEYGHEQPLMTPDDLNPFLRRCIRVQQT